MDEGRGQSQGQDENAGWQYKPDATSAPAGGNNGFSPAAAPANGAAQNLPSEVEWTASEFVAHDKGVGWYLILALVSLIIGGLVYLITSDIFSTAVVIILGIIFGVAGSRKPRVLTYRLTREGITAGNKFYPYGDYKSFAYLDEHPFASIVFIPLKRFGFPLSVYLAPEDEHRVLEVLATHLPLERGEIGVIDSLMRRARF